MRRCVIIPARYGSSRFPGKPLTPLLGKPMVIWVAELSARAVGAENTFVATEDRRIAEVVQAAGFVALMTSENALTGTDRLAEASMQVDYDIYVNVQGDEPLINPTDILAIADRKATDLSVIVNGFCWISENEDAHNVNIPKVVASEDGTLLYMSRAAVPGFKDPKCAPDRYAKQVCIYAFTRDDLDAFVEFGRKGRIEAIEDIEILRFFELGRKIVVVETTSGSLAIDTPSDVALVEAELRRTVPNNDAN